MSAQLMRSGTGGLMGAEGLRAMSGLLRNLSSSLMIGPDALLGGPGGLLRGASLGAPRWSLATATRAAAQNDDEAAVSAPQTARAWRPSDPLLSFKAEPEPWCVPTPHLLAAPVTPPHLVDERQQHPLTAGETEPYCPVFQIRDVLFPGCLVQ